jgi:predicted metal-binding protein
MMMQAVASPLIKTHFQDKEIQIESKEIELPIEAILPYLNPEEFNAYCKTGCENYSNKWTCPPHCPDFMEYATDHTHIKLILYKSDCNQFEFIKESERALTAYNFAKDLLQKNLRKSEDEQERFIGPNSCEICPICKAAQAEVCHLPHLIRYNLVAFGFNVTKIMEELFQHQLEWAKAGEVPNHVSSVGAILLKK